MFLGTGVEGEGAEGGDARDIQYRRRRGGKEVHTSEHVLLTKKS